MGVVLFHTGRQTDTDRHDITRPIVTLTYGNIPLLFCAMYRILIKKDLHTDVLGLTPAALLQICDVLTTATRHRICKRLPT
jgi:hypothetical protein